jgi:putative DNA primase/helicase
MDLRAVARLYISKGLSVIPLDNNKRPTVIWQHYSKRVMTDKEIDEKFADAYGIGIIGGEISGGLEMIDWDLKYSLNPEMYTEAWSRVPADLQKKLVVFTTVNKGFHWYYRTNIQEGNKKLAQRFSTPEEQGENTHDKVRVLAETRGVGGYCCAYPTPGYTRVSGNVIHNITDEERNLLLDICRSYNEVYNESELFERTTVEKGKRLLKSPFDDYNSRESAATVASSYGWRAVGKFQADKLRMLRPGNTSSEHSGYYSQSKNRLSVFSTSTILEANKSYTPSELLTIYSFSGDWKKSFKFLLDAGYGQMVDPEKEIKGFIEKLKSSRIVDVVHSTYGGVINSPTEITIDGKKYQI